ncbi:MAG TPA: hydrogenase maturation protease [Gemmatimonadales bacterium]|jgi:hydrogenase maturation protease
MNGRDMVGARTPSSIRIGDIDVSAGSRVRLAPRASRDFLDLALAGKAATVESIELDIEGSPHFIVSVDDDRVREFRDHQIFGHRFFFRVDEVMPVDRAFHDAASRVLVAGIGNIFKADDGWGIEVVQRLKADGKVVGADVVDFGVRGMDLAYAIAQYDTVLLVDAAPRGILPGTVTLVNADRAWPDAGHDVHGVDPFRVLALARSLGAMPVRILVVACEPEQSGDGDDVTVGLSPAVAAAIDPAVAMIVSLVRDARSERGWDDPGEVTSERPALTLM